MASQHRYESSTIKMPAEWASYLINADPSGLCDEEIAACDAYVAKHVYRDGWGIVGCPDGETASFGRFQGLGTDLLTYDLLRPAKP